MNWGHVTSGADKTDHEETNPEGGTLKKNPMIWDKKDRVTKLKETEDINFMGNVKLERFGEKKLKKTFWGQLNST